MSRTKFYLVTCLLSLFFSVLVFWADQNISSAHLVNLKGRDLFFKFRHVASKSPQEINQILIVTIDDETLKRLEARWPYPRSIYGSLIDRLKLFSPKAIGFDLIFSGHDFSEESDLVFSEAIKSAENVVVATHQSTVGTLGPTSEISKNVWSLGIVDKPRDVDGCIRRFYSSFQTSGNVFPSWEDALFKKTNPAGALSAMWDKQGHIIDYIAQPKDFLHASFWRVLEGSVLSKDVENKIVLIGPAAKVFHDIHETPLGEMPGIFVNANALLMLLMQTEFKLAPQKIIFLIAWLFIWLALLMGFSHYFFRSIALVVGLSIICLGVSYLLFLNYFILDFWLLALVVFLLVISASIFRYIEFRLLHIKIARFSIRKPINVYPEEFLFPKLELELKNMIFQKGKDVCLLAIRFDPNQTDSGFRLIASSVRQNELICRFGSDLLIILPNTSVGDAEKFQIKLAQILRNEQPATLTVVSARKARVFGAKKLVKAAQRQLI